MGVQWPHERFRSTNVMLFTQYTGGPSNDAEWVILRLPGKGPLTYAGQERPTYRPPTTRDAW